MSASTHERLYRDFSDELWLLGLEPEERTERTIYVHDGGRLVMKAVEVRWPAFAETDRASVVVSEVS